MKEIWFHWIHQMTGETDGLGLILEFFKNFAAVCTLNKNPIGKGDKCRRKF